MHMAHTPVCTCMNVGCAASWALNDFNRNPILSLESRTGTGARTLPTAPCSRLVYESPAEARFVRRIRVIPTEGLRRPARGSEPTLYVSTTRRFEVD